MNLYPFTLVQHWCNLPRFRIAADLHSYFNPIYLSPHLALSYISHMFPDYLLPFNICNACECLYKPRGWPAGILHNLVHTGPPPPYAVYPYISDVSLSVALYHIQHAVISGLSATSHRFAFAAEKNVIVSSCILRGILANGTREIAMWIQTVLRTTSIPSNLRSVSIPRN